MRQIIIDTETTGLDPQQGHRIIEFAAIELVDRRATGRALHFRVDPERDWRLVRERRRVVRHAAALELGGRNLQCTGNDSGARLLDALHRRRGDA